MKGTNKVRGVEASDGSVVQVHEVFFTVQGEGPFSGERAVFVRLTGCCLRCWWCDTEWDDDNDPRQTVQAVAEKATDAFEDASQRGAPKLVVITGGEPTNWKLGPLCRALYDAGFERVQVETAGVRWDDAFALPFVYVVVSPKTPNIETRLRYPNPRVWFKYPLGAGEVSAVDGLPVTNTQQRSGRTRPLARPDWLFDTPERVFVTPLDIGDPAIDALNRELVGESAMRYGYTAQLQIHKSLRLP